MHQSESSRGGKRESGSGWTSKAEQPSSAGRWRVECRERGRGKNGPKEGSVSASEDGAGRWMLRRPQGENWPRVGALSPSQHRAHSFTQTWAWSFSAVSQSS